MSTTAGTMARGWRHYQAGDFRQAEQAFRSVVGEDPLQVEAWYLLGAACQGQGKLEDAVGCYQEALTIKPDHAEILNNLGVAFAAQGKLAEAITSYRQALRHKPDYPEVYKNMGVDLAAQGKLEESIASFQEAVRLRPSYAEAYENLRRALAARPAAANTGQPPPPEGAVAELCNQGLALWRQGDLTAAAERFQQALRLQPDSAEMLNNLGIVRNDQGNPVEAIGCYQQALQLWPSYPEAYNNLGIALLAVGRAEESVASFRQALRCRADYPEAYNNLGNAQWQQGRLDEAAASYQQALRCRPEYAEVSSNLGLLLKDMGKLAEAEAHLRAALRLRTNPALRLVLATLLPAIYQSNAEVLTWRRRFTDNVRQLHQEHFQFDLTTQKATPPFFLVYQGLDDRDLQRDLTGLYAAPRDVPRPGRKGGKINVGFISRYFRNHIVAQLMRGLIANLSRDAFAVTVLSVGATYQDPIARFIQEQADAFVEVPLDLPAARSLIAAQDLDVLIYTDVGMDETTYSLAFSRLAPVQCVTWGHGVTTGIGTLDYFLSGELLETEAGDQHYTERLVRLPNLGVYYYRPVVPVPLLGRAHFGLPEDKHLYGCLQSLFKFHPDFDAVLGGILRRDPQGVVVLLQAENSYLEKLLRQRFAATLPDVVDRILFVPRQRNDGFRNLMALLDVVLDPLYNVGGNSSFEGLAMGVPIVTLPTQHLGGRLTRALYAQMDVWDCVVASTEEYVDRAVQLGTDPAYRSAVRDKIQTANSVLYENPAGLRGLEKFLQKAVAAV